MKMGKVIWPSWWYLLASIPLLSTSLMSGKFLETESHKYTFGGLRNIFVLNVVNFAEVLGLGAAIGILLFIGSAFLPKLHDARVSKAFGLVALFLYGWWSVNAAIWITIK